MEETIAELFEKFYGKPFDEISPEDIGKGEELDWGEDVGGEVLPDEAADAGTSRHEKTSG